MRIIFMGTPDIAAVSLLALLQNRQDVVAVFTRADKPVGRKQVLTAPPVKQTALQYNIPVYQPSTLKDGQAEEIISGLAPDLIVVVAYGRLLPAEILTLPKHGCINLHVSLLPQYRGAAPVQWAVINGEEKTGVTIMQLDEGLDTGPILSQKEIPIDKEETAGELFEAVSGVGAQLLCETVAAIEAGQAALTPQQGEASSAPPLKKEMARLDFTKSSEKLHNLVRGCNPWPLAWFMFNGKRIKVTRTKSREDIKGQAGEILAIKPLTIGCGQGALVLEDVVPEGSRPMPGKDWAAGRRFAVGDSILQE